MSNTGPLKVCVCGGGNGAHVLAGLAASNNDIETRVLSLYEDEAERWWNITKKEGLTVMINEKDGTTRDVKSCPRMITNDAKEAISATDIVILTLPAFAHESYFQAIEPHISRNTLIVGLPGQPGFEFQCCDILGSKAEYCTIMSFETLPWACRIVEFGKKVEILGTKSYLAGSMIRGRGICRRPPLMSLQMLHGSEPLFRQAKHFLEILIMSYSFVHPAILYGQWKDWDNKPVQEAPLFYQGISKETAELLDLCSQECMAVAQAIMNNPDVNADLSDVKELYQWFMDYYRDDIENNQDLYHVITTNKSYKGLRHPMIEVDGGLVPDFQNRYLTEDLPMGLVVFRGLADAAGVSVPTTDMLLEWGQSKTGKEYLVNGELKGADMSSTRCPQRYGFKTLKEIVEGKRENV